MAEANIIALIQARAGSKGVPRKNIRPLAGHPMMAYSILAAQLCDVIERTIVSTDSAPFADIAKSYGAEVPFLRPAIYASDTATDADVIRHALDWLAENENHEPDLVVQLRPTTRVRDADVIDQAIGRLIAHPEATSLRSAHAMAEPPEKMFRLAGEYFAGLFPDDLRPEYFHLPRQAFPASYHPNGYVDIVRTAYIRAAQNGSIYGERILAMTTPFAPEVDVPEDIAYLEFLLRKSGYPLCDLLDRRFPQAV